MSTVLYQYGFVPPDVSLAENGLAGIDDRPVELLDLEGVHAVVSRVPAAVYAADPLEQRLQDFRWVAEQGMRHEEVVAWFVDHARILPVRLFTLHSSSAALEEATAAKLPEIRDQMRRLGARREWDLKVAYSARRLAANLADVSDDVAALDAEIAEATAGKRFLLEKKREDLARGETADAARRIAGEVLDDLREMAADVTRLALPKQATELPVVLYAALLVPPEREERLRSVARARAEELEPLGVEVGLSGPWAPYRFLQEAS